MVKNYRNRFKCRCMGSEKTHDAGVEVMSGTWKVHRSLISLTQPQGLHRNFYQVIFNEDNDNRLFDDKENFEDCFKKIIYRYRRF